MKKISKLNYIKKFFLFFIDKNLMKYYCFFCLLEFFFGQLKHFHLSIYFNDDFFERFMIILPSYYFFFLYFAISILITKTS